MQKQLTFAAIAAALAISLTACGGGSGGDDDNGDGSGDGGGTPTAGFASTPVMWTLTLPTTGGGIVCFDFDAAAEVSCDNGTAWDLRLDASSQAPTFRSNGGVTNATGSGAAFAFFDWSTLSGWTNATTDPGTGTDVSSLYTEDSASSIFTSESWYAYGVTGASDHSLYPNYRIYLVNDNPADSTATTFAMQVIGYYGGASGTTSGYPQIRWIDRETPDDVRTATIDASSETAWVYYDLANGTVVDLTDDAAASSTAWQIAFRRYEIKLNGGSSGSSTVAGYLGKQIDGFYDEDGAPIAATFTSTTPDETLAALQANDFDTPARSSGWVSDSEGSVLTPPYTGSYPGALDYGFYSYNPTADAANGLPAHRLSANADNGALLRSGDGLSYARVHLTDISYATPADITSAQTWTFEFNVQPAE